MLVYVCNNVLLNLFEHYSIIVLYICMCVRLYFGMHFGMHGGGVHMGCLECEPNTQWMCVFGCLLGLI